MASEDLLLKALQPYSTCDISDALLALKHPNGGFLSNISMWSPQRQEGSTKIVGLAYTVRYVPKGAHGTTNQGHYIDSVPAGAVIFISAPKTVNAVYGGLMTRRARVSGAVGTVVDGRVRDLQEHRGLGYPVFARDVGTAAPYEVVEVDGVDVPVKLQTDEQDVTINPGDYIIGDLNGVVCLPQELAEKTVALLPLQAEADHLVAQDIQAGIKFTDASKKRRAALRKP